MTLPDLTGVRRPPRALLRAGRPVAAAVVRARWDLRLHHAERVPKDGPVIFAPNHAGWLDGPLLAVVSPRPVHALTKQEMFTGPLAVLLRRAGQIRLDRFHVDPGAVKTCLRVLESGGAVGVFPEGTRGDGELARVKCGAAYLALVSGAPVVPVSFFGTREPGGRSGSIPGRGARFDVVYGDPVHLGQQPWPRTRDDVLRATHLLAGRLREHLADAKALTGRSLPGPLPDPEEEA